mgnify:CR=1 FL=1
MTTRAVKRPRWFYGWTIVATLCMVNFATAATGTLNLGLFIIPMSEGLGISRGIFGWLSTSRSLAAGGSSLVLGSLVDRFGVRILLPLSSLVTGLCLIGIGASSQMYQVFILFALMGLVGLGSQAGSLLSSVPVAKWFVAKRGKALSIAMLGGGIGAIVFVPVTQVLIDNLGWRWAWMVLAFISMAVIIPLSMAFIRRQPEDMGLQPDGGTSAVQKERSVHTAPADTEVIWTVREALRTRAFWQLTASLMLSGFAMGTAIHRIPYWTERGFDAQTVSLAFSADAAGAAFMIMASGFVLDRVPSRFTAASAFAGFAGAVTIMLVATNVLHMFTSTVLFGFSAGTNQVSQTYLWARYYGRASLGTIRGITMPMTLLATAAGAPAAGYIYDITGGYELAWQIAISIYILAFLLMVTALPPVRTLPGQPRPATGG